MALMDSYKARQFNLSNLKGISDETLEMHFKLYQGYVKETNKLSEKIRHLFLIDVAVLNELPDLLAQLVGLFDIALIQLEVHLERFVRDSLQAAEVKFSRFICPRKTHARLLLYPD